MKIARILLSLLLLTSIVACSSSEEDKEQAAKDEQAKEDKTAAAKAATETYKPKLVCPQVAIVRSLGTVRDYGTEKPDPSQLVAAARMEGIEGNCGYQDDGGIDIQFTMHFVAAKGPRLGGDRVEFPFFVAVIDPTGAILNKNQMGEAFKFKSGKNLTDIDEPLHIFIPLAKDKSQTGRDYRVLAGFQLTPDQLKEARKEEAAKVKSISQP